jgi:hypothetical protein
MSTAIFYDSNNTAFYVDPASVSNINELWGSGKQIFRTDDNYLRINQSASFSSGIWFGQSNRLSDSNTYIAAGGNGGTTSSKVYIFGGAYTGTNVIKIDGNSGIIQTTTDSMRAPIFYDYNSTGYYLDPASTSKSAHLRGVVEIINETPQLVLNDFTATNTTNQSGYISYQQNGTETGWVGFGSESNNYLSVRNTSGLVHIHGDYTLHNGSSRAPIFYDSGNTAYYVDPAGTSVVSKIVGAEFTGRLKNGGTGPNTENLNTIADAVTVGQLEYRGYNSSSTNKPPAVDNANGVITVGQHSGLYSAQLAFSSDGNMHWRDNPGTSYGSWRKIWDAGNDGSGSGLDADLLDGVQASQFLRSDATDTATGNLTFTGIVSLNNNSNEYSGHLYYNPLDANGNHYPHFRDGSNANGVNINWRLYSGAASLITHTWNYTDTKLCKFTKKHGRYACSYILRF